MSRIEEKFKQLRSQQKCAFVAYICAGHPNYEISLQALHSLPKSGVDIIELGVPFLDPAGDGPIIETAAKQAIANGMSLKKTLEMVAEFRKVNSQTPIILMTYYNPVLKYGLNKIFVDAEKSGVDGFLIVDLPFEEENEIKAEILHTKLALINLIAPTTNQERSKKVSQNSSGFLYLISMLGITGTKLAESSANKENLKKLREVTNLPIVIGFGIQNPQQAGEFSKIGADGVVIGSVIVKEIDKNFVNKKSSTEIISSLSKLVEEFSQKIKS